MKLNLIFITALTLYSLTCLTLPVLAQTSTSFTLTEEIIVDVRPVIARLEASDTATARSRLSGIIIRLNIDEGSVVQKGQTLAIVRDESLKPQIEALDAKISGIEKQLTQYKTELSNAQKLLAKGFVSPVKRDQARTVVDVTAKNLKSVQAQRATLISRQSKGVIKSPANALVTEVNIVEGSTVSPGEVIAKLSTLEGVVRLALPERHAGQIKQGQIITIRLPTRSDQHKQATITKIYPSLRAGAVIADAVVDGGLSALVGERVDVLVPIGERRALRIPKTYIDTRYGIDFVKVHVGEYIIDAPVTLANPIAAADGYVEILAGLHIGDVIELP
ncbi:MAG: efflux RND transporter periplasmic adaptor subunit [Robiginitomaculum sp.]|nr:efflux RND transporter periplasmic adaptor subunit [Robiginitomaculum sp.]